jgi:acyl carrier protein
LTNYIKEKKKDPQQILAELHPIFHDVFNDPSLTINHETSADDIGNWNSLTHMTLIVEVEKYFQCEFSFTEVMSFTNVGDMIQAIQHKLA